MARVTGTPLRFQVTAGGVPCPWGLAEGPLGHACGLTPCPCPREHDRAHPGVLQQPAGLERVGGAPAEADQGHVPGHTLRQAPLSAIPHRKSPGAHSLPAFWLLLQGQVFPVCAGAVLGARVWFHMGWEMNSGNRAWLYLEYSVDLALALFSGPSGVWIWDLGYISMSPIEGRPQGVLGQGTASCYPCPSLDAANAPVPYLCHWNGCRAMC